MAQGEQKEEGRQVNAVVKNKHLYYQHLSGVSDVIGDAAWTFQPDPDKATVLDSVERANKIAKQFGPAAYVEPKPSNGEP